MAYVNLPALNWNNVQTINAQDLQTYFNQYNDSINAFANAIAISENGVTKLNPAKVKLTQFGLNGITADAITGADISNALLKGVQDFTFQTATGAPAFSATDNDTVAWSAFTLIFSDGSQYPIDAGNTGNVSTSVVTYVYWDKAISLSVLQTTTDFTATVGQDRKLCCVVWGTADTSQKAGFVPAVGVFGANSVNILANSISAASIQAGAVTAAKIDVANLSAISATLGTVTIGGSGYLRQGQTAYATGTGFWLGDVSGTPKFSIGTSTNFFKFDGSGISVQADDGTDRMTFSTPIIQFTNTDSPGSRVTLSVDGLTVEYGSPLNTIFKVATGGVGISPFNVNATTLCTNLNADLLDGSHASSFAPSSGANYSNWDTAYTDRLKWDGGSTGLNAATGRTSLGLGSLATVNVGQTGSFPDGNLNSITVVDGIITAGL